MRGSRGLLVAFCDEVGVRSVLASSVASVFSKSHFFKALVAAGSTPIVFLHPCLAVYYAH